MGLKTFVKISNVSSLSDARYCAGMMVDVIGFSIDPSKESYVNEVDFKEITDWVAGVSFAGEFYGANEQMIKDTVKKYPVDFIEIDNLSLVEKIGLLGKPLIIRLSINNEAELAQLKSTLSYLDELVEIVVIKSNTTELHKSIDSQVCFYNGNLKLLKGYGIEPEESLAKYPGLELEATKEERPGFKDYGQIMDVLEIIEDD